MARSFPSSSSLSALLCNSWLVLFPPLVPCLPFFATSSLPSLTFHYPHQFHHRLVSTFSQSIHPHQQTSPIFLIRSFHQPLFTLSSFHLLFLSSFFLSLCIFPHPSSITCLKTMFYSLIFSSLFLQPLVHLTTSFSQKNFDEPSFLLSFSLPLFLSFSFSPLFFAPSLSLFLYSDFTLQKNPFTCKEEPTPFSQLVINSSFITSYDEGKSYED